MRIQDSNTSLRRSPGARRPAKPAAAPAAAGSVLGADRFVSSSPRAESALGVVPTERQRLEEEEKARWRRMRLILLAGFKPTASGAEVLIDVADAKEQDRRKAQP